MPATRSATGAALMTEINTDLSNWKITLSLSQKNAFVAHIEQLILNNSGTVIADCTADLATWPEPARSHHT